MTNEELIERITAEVLKQLRQERESGSSAAAPPAAGGRKVLLLYAGGYQGREQAVALAEELAGAGSQLRLVCTPAAQNILGQTLLRRLAATGELVNVQSEPAIYQAVHWADVVAVPILTQNTLVKAALGIRDTAAANLLASAIMMDRRILVCTDSAIPSSGPDRYRALLTGYVDLLRGFGVQTVPLDGMARACLDEPARASQASGSPSAPAGAAAQRRAVVTAADVEAAARRGQHELPVPEGAIVTPLARDLCRQHSIAIVSPNGRKTHEAG